MLRKLNMISITFTLSSLVSSALFFFVNYVIIFLGKCSPFKRNFPFVSHT